MVELGYAGACASADAGAGVLNCYGGYALPIDANLTEIHLNVKAAGNCRVAVYTGVSGDLDLLVESGSEACGANDWHVFDIADTFCAAQNIWIGSQMEGAASNGYDVTGGGYRGDGGLLGYGAFPANFVKGWDVNNSQRGLHVVYVAAGATVKKGSSLNATMAMMLNSRMLYSACNPFKLKV